MLNIILDINCVSCAVSDEMLKKSSFSKKMQHWSFTLDFSLHPFYFFFLSKNYD